MKKKFFPNKFVNFYLQIKELQKGKCPSEKEVFLETKEKNFLKYHSELREEFVYMDKIPLEILFRYRYRIPSLIFFSRIFRNDMHASISTNIISIQKAIKNKSSVVVQKSVRLQKLVWPFNIE